MSRAAGRHEPAADVLLVEDDADDVALIRRALEGRDGGPRILPVGTVAAAEDAFSAPAARYGLVLLDVRLPGESGFAFLRWRAERPAVARVPVVVFSNSDAPDDIATAYDLRANSYLFKPTDFRDLRALLLETVDYWTERNCPPPR